VEIHRDDILGSSMRSLADFNSSNLKRRIQVQFVSDQGIREPGIDGGGLFKEFLEVLCSVGFDSSPGRNLSRLPSYTAHSRFI
jgi:ubiquitin-protein ligase E3 C